jgi:RecA/RadA recombinase
MTVMITGVVRDGLNREPSSPVSSEVLKGIQKAEKFIETLIAIVTGKKKSEWENQKLQDKLDKVREWLRNQRAYEIWANRVMQRIHLEVGDPSTKLKGLAHAIYRKLNEISNPNERVNRTRRVPSL